VSAAMKGLRDHYGGEEGLAQELEEIGIQESELLSILRLEFSILKFENFRFRPFAPRASIKDIENYYNERYVPQLQNLGLEIPPLETVSSEIEDNLIEEQINADFDQWIQDTRRNARIEYFNANSLDVSETEDSGNRIQTVTGE
jgi:hypothetical protein